MAKPHRAVQGGGAEHLDHWRGDGTRGDGWRGPAIVGFFHHFAQPEIERRFQETMLPTNRWRLVVIVGLTAGLAGSAMLVRQIGLFSDYQGFHLWPAYLQTAIAAAALLALWRGNSLAAMEVTAILFAAAYMALRCVAITVQPALAESSGAALIGTIALLYLGLPIRPGILMPLMIAGSTAMAGAWILQPGPPGLPANTQVVQWIVVMNVVLTINVRLLRFSVRHQWAQTQALRRMSAYDELTEVANRRAYESVLTKEWQRCQNIGAPVSLIVVDIDFFKLLNDTVGHAAGDACLRDVASLLESCLSRPGQMLARTGGDEFAVLLPETTETEARSIAKRVVETLRDTAIGHPCSPLGDHLTLSVGIATGRAGEGFSAWELTALADRLVYAAKREGRNRIRQESLGVEAPPAPAGRLDAAGRSFAVG